MQITQSLIESFVDTSKLNNLINVHAYLPSNHPLIVNRVVRQMRKGKQFNCYAYGYDELGNKVSLGLNGFIFN